MTEMRLFSSSGLPEQENGVFDVVAVGEAHAGVDQRHLDEPTLLFLNEPLNEPLPLPLIETYFVLILPFFM